MHISKLMCEFVRFYYYLLLVVLGAAFTFSLFVFLLLLWFASLYSLALCAACDVNGIKTSLFIDLNGNVRTTAASE